MKRVRSKVRRYLAATLALMMCLSLLPMSAMATDDTESDWTIAYNKTTGTAIASKYSGSATVITVPSSTKDLDGNIYPVTEVDAIMVNDTAREAAVTSITIPASVTTIKKIAFQNCTGLQTVTFESGSKLATIGESAFNGCTALQSIEIPSGVTSIGESAFNGCTSLTNVTFDDSVKLTTLGSSAFRGCAKLASINLPSSVTDIQMYAFYGDTSLTNINLAGATGIGMYAFLGCKNLADVTLGNNLTSIGINAFNGCPITAIALPDTLTTIGASAFSGCKLQSVTIPAKVTEIGNYAFYGNTALTSLTINNAAASVGNYVFEGCTALASANLGTGVTSIGESAFSGDAALTSITIPASVTALGKEAFYNCSALATLTVNDAPVDIGSNAFKGCTNLTSVSLGTKLTGIGTRAFIDCTKLAGTVTIPATVKTLGEYAFYGCTSLTGAVINATAAIGDNAFSGCTALTSLTLGSGVTAIGEGAFSGCAAVKENLTIPDSVTTIGASAFSKCSGLTGVTLPAKLTSLGEDTFYQCTDLAGTVTIPSGVTMIPKSAFTNCKALSGVVLQGDVTEIGAYAFSGCTALTSCPLPDTVKVIDAYAFSSAGITSIALPANLESIGISAFSGTRFTSIIIPSKVTAIADYTFFSCINLETVKLPDGLKTIGDYAFSSCGKLASVNLPSKLSQIGQEALSNCTSLPSVVIPDSVTTIGQKAFENCTSLKSATISKSVTSIAYATFGDCTSLPSITIPEGVTAIGRNAFGMCTNLTKVTLPSTLKSVYAKAFDRAAYTNDAFTAHSVDYRGTAAQWTALQTWNSDANTGINWDKNVSNDLGNTGNDYLKNDITITTDVKPAYTGTLAAAPTVASKSGGSVTLNVVTVTDESVEYGYSIGAAVAPAIWQDAVDFTNVPAGENYFFARVKETSTHLAGGMSAASAPVTVYAKPTVSYGTMDTLVIGTAITDMTPNAAVTAGAAERNPYTMTGTLPAGLTFNTSTGIISGTPTTYATVGGSVTVTVTDKESIVSDPYTVIYGPVAKTANTMTSVTQADVAYNGTVSPVNPIVNAYNGNTPVFTYKAQGADDSTYSSAAPTQAGAYTVKAASSGSATVADASVTANFNITPITLTGSDLEYTGTVTKVYDGTTSCALTSVGVKSSSLKTGDAAMTVSGTAVYDSKDVSAAKVTFTPSAITTGNYRLAEAETFDITAAITAFIDVTDSTNADQAVVKGDGSFAVPTFGGTNSESATGTIAYTYGSAAKSYDEIKTALAALNSGYTASISYTFTGNGNYTGASVNGTINATIVDIAFTVGTATATETNAVTKAASPTYGMTWAQLVSINSGSITAKVGANTVTGTYKLDVSGTPDAGNKTFKVLFNGTLGGVTYTDVTVCTGSITVAPKAAALTVSTIPAQLYTGSAVEPAVTVKDSDKTLTLTTDYTVSYKNNTDAGTAEVTVAGAGNYAGSTGTASFTISPMAIAKSNFTALTTDAGTYTGSPVTQNIASASLKQGTDYTVAYTNNINAGTASYTVTGAGNYTGSITRSFTIAPKTITVTPNAGLTKTYGAADPALTYTASGLVGTDKVTGTLKRDAGEYVGTYSINDISGLTAGGNYTLSLDSTSVNFTITQATYILSGIPATLYIGSTFNADTIKNAVKDAGTVTITNVALQKSDGTSVTDADADAIATVGASNAVNAKGAGKVVVTYSIAANDINKDNSNEYGEVVGKTVTLTLVSAPAPAGGGSSTGTVTVPASSNAGSASVDAKVDGSAATVAPTDAQIAAVASATKETGTVQIDLTSLKVNTAVLPEKLVSAAQNADAGAGLAVILPTGKVEMDKTALSAVAGKGDLELSVKVVPTTELTPAQKTVLGNQKDSALVVDVKMLTDGKETTSFAGGQLTVRVPYTLKPGEDASGLVVWFLKADGTLEPHAASYDAKTGTVTFTTTHLSRYFIASFPFADVAESSYCYTAVAWAAGNGITDGKTATTFDPSASCTRAQVVTFLWRAMGSPEPAGTANPFTDVSSDAYYYKAVLWAVEKGITKGTTNTTFDPDATVTRAQAVTFQYRAAGSPGAAAANPFSDVASGAYYTDAVLWAVNSGVTKGTSATAFSPAQTCTRDQIVTFLWRQFGI